MSGAEADGILDRPHVHRVAGDEKGGFYRPRAGYGDSRGACGVVLEAYRWSELPSGAAARALSLVFLLPFMLCNSAIWMRPRAPRPGAAVWVLCRLLGLTLTALYTLSFVGVALDLLACKCMSSSSCLGGRSWMSWLGGQAIGLRLALLSLIPVAAIGILWRLGSQCGHWSENFSPPEGMAQRRSLSSIGRQEALPAVARLRLIHVAAALTVLDLSLLAARWAGHGPSAGNGVLAACGTGAIAGCVILLSLPNALDAPRPSRRVDVGVVALQATAYGLTVIVLALTLFDNGDWPAEAGLPGHASAVVLLFVTQGVLLALLAIAAFLGRRADPETRGALHGLGAPVFASFAVGLAVVFATELNFRVSDYLDRDGYTPEVLPTSPVLPYKWTMFGFFLSVIATALVGGALMMLSRRRRMESADELVSRDFPSKSPQTEGRRKHARRAIARALFTERLATLTVTAFCVAAVSLGVSGLGLAELQPSVAAEEMASIPRDFVNAGTQYGSYLMALVFIGLLIGGVFAYRTIAFRRYIGILWDLGMFWPRAAHPFTPPCYAERAVPELARRVTALVERGDRVLIGAHSHGSVLAAASLLQLEPHVLPKVALLTHSSPLRRLYAVLFPAHVGTDVLRELGSQIGWRWVNLWRVTDPIGGWIFSPDGRESAPTPLPAEATVDRRLTDPRSLVIEGEDTVSPPIQGHRPCVSDDRYQAAVCYLAHRLRTDQ
ncbi:hypothetical protein [Micromonospora thermarum]|uniref:Integral membrane protein n=1 Tax=Micromonospora thermarum TaxID=2720024 RepID=A0ABX0Z448_9ACTN|nr:hypothetical protein [Micromonospora thermarum]NJP31927.1 hypothetical protein [Micromonospora thermarum]